MFTISCANRVDLVRFHSFCSPRSNGVRPPRRRGGRSVPDAGCLHAAAATGRVHAAAAAFSPVSLGGQLNGGAGGLVECWGAMTELRSCTDEIVLFFLNGETTRLGPGCCRAVRAVTRNCWPAMLAAVGVTAEEANVLRGLCDAEAADSPPPSPAPSAA